LGKMEPMFTGIIEVCGKTKEISTGKGRLSIETGWPDVQAGESIAVNGACLTVRQSAKGLLVFDLSRETLQRTTLGRLRTGAPVNLERALRLSDRLGGHLVTGHVDGKGRIVNLRKIGSGKEMSVYFPTELRKYLFLKGAVAVEGVSLTVAGLSGSRFSAALVPYTLEKTNLGEKRVGDEVNLEVDILARYLIPIRTGIVERKLV